MKLVDEITKLKMDKNSSEISIPGSYLSKKFLSKFKNLKKVKLIGKFTLTQEAIDLFKSCDIKEVEGEFTLDEALKGLEPSWYYIYKTHGYSYFQDIVINEIKEDDESLPYVHIKNAKLM